MLNGLIQRKLYTRMAPEASDLEGWQKVRAGIEAASAEANRKAIERTGVTVIEAELGGVPVLDIRPEGWKNSRKVLVYTHGGAYTVFSARSILGSSAPMCQVTGLRVISVDYTTAPFEDPGTGSLRAISHATILPSVTAVIVWLHMHKNIMQVQENNEKIVLHKGRDG